MADFCHTCCEAVLGVQGELNDLRDLCVAGDYAHVLCEGCGFIVVDRHT